MKKKMMKMKIKFLKKTLTLIPKKLRNQFMCIKNFY